MIGGGRVDTSGQTDGCCNLILNNLKKEKENLKNKRIKWSPSTRGGGQRFARYLRLCSRMLSGSEPMVPTGTAMISPPVPKEVKERRKEVWPMAGSLGASVLGHSGLG